MMSVSKLHKHDQMKFSGEWSLSSLPPPYSSCAQGNNHSPNRRSATSIVSEAWTALRCSLVFFREQPVGTIAALDKSRDELSFDQVFVRDFVPSALVFLMNGEPEIVKNFLLRTLRLQPWQKKIDRVKLGRSFKVHHDPVRESETLVADFGESAIGRLASVDTGLWWIILLRAYIKSTGDSISPDCPMGMRIILGLCLSEGFDTFPTLLSADGCSKIDRQIVSTLTEMFSFFGV